MLNLFNTIAKVSSPKDKVALLKDYSYQGELKTMLKLATDPFITFGVTSVEGEPLMNQDVVEVLGRCMRRELTGNAAKLQLGEACADKDEQELITRVLRKDLRCGVGEKLVLQAYPGLIRQFNVMRADKFETLNKRYSYVIEPKYDGLRCIAIVEDGTVTLLSRNGKEFTSSDHLKPQLLKLAESIGDCVFDGELTAGNFNESVSAVKKKDQQDDSAVYNVFDVLDMVEWNNPITPYYQRRGYLTTAFGRAGTLANLKLVPSHKVENEDEAFRFYNRFLSQGYEGGIVKNNQGLYRFKRHKDWLKLKEVNEVDLRVESLVQGEGKYYGMLGALIVKYKGKRVSVGAGFSDEERALWWKEPSLIQGKTIEVRYHQETPDGSLRHPRLYRIRDDK
jgi:DNA ligase-1